MPRTTRNTLTTIAEGFRDQKVDIVIAIGTQPLQTAYQVLKDTGIPIVFNSVTDPYQAGVAKSETDHPGLTGVQALPPVTQAFDLIFAVKPDAKKVGIIWTSSEKNSEVATGIAREYAKSKGVEFIERQVTKADEVLSAAEALAAEQVDAIFLSTDSTVVSALESVVKVAGESKILLACNDPASAKRGCATALGLELPRQRLPERDHGYLHPQGREEARRDRDHQAAEQYHRAQHRRRAAAGRDAARQPQGPGQADVRCDHAEDVMRDA